MIIAAILNVDSGFKITKQIKIYKTSYLAENIINETILKSLADNESLEFWQQINLKPISLDPDADLLSNQNQFARDLIDATILRFHLLPSIYFSNSRRRIYNDVKFCIYKILRDNTNLSLAAIGELHNRDHTTILSGLKRFHELSETDIDFRKMYNDIKNIMENILINQNNENENI